MFFRNLCLYRFSKAAATALDEDLEAALAGAALKPCGPQEMSSRGFVSPFGRGEEEFVANFGAFRLMTLGGEDRLLPSAVVNEAVAGKIAALEEERGRPLGGRERKRIKEEAVFEMLPRAFIRPSRLSAYADVKHGWLVVDTSSRKAGEGFLTVLRQALESFPAVPPDPEESPRALMTAWLADGKLPPGFELGDECELKDPVDGGAIVRCRRQDLASDEVHEHLKSGKQVAQLGLVADGRVSLVLGDDLVVRKLKFLDVAVGELEQAEHGSPRAEFDARFALMCMTLQPLLERLDEVFRLPRPNERGKR